MAQTFKRCPRCRKTLMALAVYRCPACGTLFCGGCDDDERPVPELGWLAAAVAEAGLESCPVCTGPVDEKNIIGVIGTDRGEAAEPGAPPDRGGS